MKFFKWYPNKTWKDILYVFLLIAAPIAFLEYISRNRVTDISLEKRFAGIYHKEFLILYDSLVFQWSDSKEYELGMPPLSTSVPSSVQEYLEDPINWVTNDSNVNQHENYSQETIIGLLKKGSRFKPIKIVSLYNVFNGKGLRIYVSIDDTRFKDLLVDVSFHITNRWEVKYNDAVPIFDPKFVQEVNH